MKTPWTKNSESNGIGEVVSQGHSMIWGKSLQCQMVRVGVSQCPTGGWRNHQGTKKAPRAQSPRRSAREVRWNRGRSVIDSCAENTNMTQCCTLTVRPTFWVAEFWAHGQSVHFWLLVSHGGNFLGHNLKSSQRLDIMKSGRNGWR
jgi:hypothetical protein